EEPVPPRPSSGGTTIYVWTDLTYLLHKSGVSWAYYGFAGDQPDCEDGLMRCAPKPQAAKCSSCTSNIWNPLPFFATVRQNGQLGNIQDISGFYAAARAGALPAVSWVAPDNAHSEHTPGL